MLSHAETRPAGMQNNFRLHNAVRVRCLQGTLHIYHSPPNIISPNVIILFHHAAGLSPLAPKAPAALSLRDHLVVNNTDGGSTDDGSSPPRDLRVSRPLGR